MNYRNRWLLVLATLTTLSVFLIAAGQTPGRVYLPVVFKEWQCPPTPTSHADNAYADITSRILGYICREHKHHINQRLGA